MTAANLLKTGKAGVAAGIALTVLPHGQLPAQHWQEIHTTYLGITKHWNLY